MSILYIIRFIWELHLIIKENIIMSYKENTDIVANRLYGMLKNKYDKLKYKKDNYIENSTFYDINDYAIISSSLSLISSHFYRFCHLPSSMLIFRNILENLALRNMYLSNKISIDSINLIKYQGFIEDYKYLYEFKELEKAGLINRKKLHIDFTNTCNVYLKYEKHKKFILKNKLPFLLKKNITYKYIVDQYLSEYMDLYQYVSRGIHPHYFSYLSEKEFIEEGVINIFQTLENIYNPLKLKVGEDFLWNSDTNNITDSSDKQFFLKELWKINIKTKKDIDFFSDSYTILKGKKTLLTDYLDKVSQILCEITSDYTLGLTEVAKAKLKVVLEIYGLMYYIIKDPNQEQKKTNILRIYTQYIQLLLSKQNVESKEEDFQRLFEWFKEIFPNSNVTYDQFIKGETKLYSNVGFIYNEDNQVNSLNSLVKSFLNDMFKEVTLDSEILVKDFLFLQYQESIILSHGSCYLYYANDGSINDSLNVFLYFYEFTFFYLKYISRMIQIMYDISNKKKEDILKMMNDMIKEITENYNKLQKLLEKQKIDIPFN